MNVNAPPLEPLTLSPVFSTGTSSDHEGLKNDMSPNSLHMAVRCNVLWVVRRPAALCGYWSPRSSCFDASGTPSA